MLLLVAFHAASTWRSDQPHSRRRIRLANACVMMLTLPLLMAGFSLIDHRAEPRLWTLVWLAAMALLTVNIALAMLDVANTLRLVRRARQRVKAALDGLSAEAYAIRRRAAEPRDRELHDGER
jgi:hypothetical protein